MWVHILFVWMGLSHLAVDLVRMGRRFVLWGLEYRHFHQLEERGWMFVRFGGVRRLAPPPPRACSTVRRVQSCARVIECRWFEM